VELGTKDFILLTGLLEAEEKDNSLPILREFDMNPLVNLVGKIAS
jgi:hypothetical protein